MSFGETLEEGFDGALTVTFNFKEGNKEGKDLFLDFHGEIV